MDIFHDSPNPLGRFISTLDSFTDLQFDVYYELCSTLNFIKGKYFTYKALVCSAFLFDELCKRFF